MGEPSQWVCDVLYLVSGLIVIVLVALLVCGLCGIEIERKSK